MNTNRYCLLMVLLILFVTSFPIAPTNPIEIASGVSFSPGGVGLASDGNPIVVLPVAGKAATYKCLDLECSSTIYTLHSNSVFPRYITPCKQAFGCFIVNDASVIQFHYCDNVNCTSTTASTLTSSANYNWNLFPDGYDSPSVLVPSDNLPIVISLHKYPSTERGSYFIKCLVSNCTSSNLVYQPGITSAGSSIWGLSAALDSNGNPTWVHSDPSSGKLNFTVCQDPACSSFSVYNLTNYSGESQFASTLSLNSNDAPIVVNGFGGIGVSVCSDAICTSSTGQLFFQFPVATRNFLRMAIDENGYPNLFLLDLDQQIFIFRCSPETCESMYPIPLGDKFSDGAKWYVNTDIIQLSESPFDVQMIFFDSDLTKVFMHRISSTTCGPGFFSVLEVCVPTLLGSYKPSNGTVVYPCPENGFCPPGSALPVCNDQFYLQNSSSEIFYCEPCPTNFLCRNDNPLPVCPENFFQYESDCIQCNSISDICRGPYFGSILECQPGFYLNTSTTCSKCPESLVCPGGVQLPQCFEQYCTFLDSQGIEKTLCLDESTCSLLATKSQKIPIIDGSDALAYTIPSFLFLGYLAFLGFIFFVSNPIISLQEIKDKTVE